LFIDIGVKPIVSDLDVVETCLDKEKMYHFLIDNKFHSPRIYDDINSVKVELDKENLNFPLVLKPQWGQGSIATEIVYNVDELEAAYSFLTSKVKNTSISHIEHLNYSNKLLIQEFITGQEFGVDCINDLDRINRAVVVKKKLAMRAGETDAAITVEDLQIQETIERLGNTLKHVSIIDIDVIKSNDKVYIIDINPRFGGGYPFSHVAGVNVPKAIINWVNNFKGQEDFFNYEKGVMSLKGINIISKTDMPL
jgi:carbamoyl-phosphate synthase large subunit